MSQACARAGEADVRRPLHVMHVIDRLAVGGAERVLVDLANQSVRDGYKVSVCLTRSGGDLCRSLLPEVRVYELGRTRRADPGAVLRFGRIVRRAGVSVLHVHGLPSFALVCLAKVGARVRAPAILHDHRGQDDPPPVRLWFRTLGTRCLSRFVGVHPRHADWARGAGVPPERVGVIGNGLDLARVPAAAPPRPGSAEPPLGVAIAGIRPEKGTDLLIQALAAVRPRFPVRLAIIGGSRDPEFLARCRELARRSGVDGDVEFWGERDDAAGELPRFDFAVMPSRSESGPLVLIEYAAAGLAVVYTDTGDVSARFRDLGVPGAVRPGSAEALAGGLAELLALEPAERRARGERGRSAALAHFGVAAVAPKWYALYHSVRGRP